MTDSFILDCSVTMSWCFEDEFDEFSQKILSSLKHRQALVPALWMLEVTNVLLIAEKHGRLKSAESTRFLELLDSLPIQISDAIFSKSELINVARNYPLTSYDATYLLLAMHQGHAIATKDKALLNASIENGVDILKV